MVKMQIQWWKCK